MYSAFARTPYCANLKSPAPSIYGAHLRQIFINYTDDMVTQQLISGLRNQNHQSRILSEAAAIPTLQQKSIVSSVSNQQRNGQA